MSRWAIGIDLGGTAIKAAIVDEKSGIITDRTIPTDTASGPAGIVVQLAGIIADLHRVASLTLDPLDCAGIGLGAPGAVNAETGTLSYPPNLPGWAVVPLRDNVLHYLQQHKELSIPVFVDNDANAAALGEALYGAGREFKDFLLVTLGTGVGGGIILNRKLYRGSNGTAGEVGFMIIDFEGSSTHAGIKGTLEGLIGKKRIVELARLMIEATPSGSSVGRFCDNDYTKLSPRHLEHAAKEGDAVSLAVWDRIGSILGVGLANVVSLMDIRKFVIGGGISAAGDLIFSPALDQLKRSTLPSMHDGLELVPALLGNKAGMYGAAALCFG
ncbi:MAG: ROK family protein [Chlorobiaceae bacterium]|nr:ROK family protein [Chlorobiaceae bacterium]NMW22680.1 ROK family protein [Chlorobiaceae bacterium]